MTKINLNTFEYSDFESAFEKAFEKAIKRIVTPPKKVNSNLKSRKETAKILSISLPTLHSFTKEGIIRAYRIGNRVLYKQEDINDALTIIVPPNKRGRQ